MGHLHRMRRRSTGGAAVNASGSKECPECHGTWPIEDFMRRVDQPWFVPPATSMARPIEPLLEQTEMAVCVVCFGEAVIRESYA